MDENVKREARNAGITERALQLIEECEKFMKENKDLLSTGNIENEEQMKRAEEVIEKIEWYNRELELEREKSNKPFKLIEKYLMKDNNVAM